EKGLAPEPPDGRGSQHKNPSRQLAHDSLNARRERLNQLVARHHVVLRRRCLYSYRLHGTLILKHASSKGGLPVRYPSQNNGRRPSNASVTSITRACLPVFLSARLKA